MKSVIKKSKEKGDHLPRLMALKADDCLVVLFDKIKDGVATGTVMAHEDSSRIGGYESGWRVDMFVPFTGSVTLSNE